MRHAAPIFRLGEELLAQHLAFAIDVPKTEIDPQTAVGLQRHLSRHQSLRVDRPPAGESGRDIDVGDVFDKSPRIDGFEQTRTIEIGTDHAGDIGAHLGLGRIGRDHVGNGDGQRLGVALRHIHRQRGHGWQRREGGQKQGADQ